MSVQKAIPLKTKGSISGILWHCCPNQQLVKELKPAIMLVVLRCYRKHLLKTPKLCLSSLPTFSHPLQPLLQGGFTPRVLSHKFVWFQTKLVSDLLKTFWKKLDWIPLPNHLPGEKNLIISISFRAACFCFQKWIMQEFSPDHSLFSFSMQLMILLVSVILSLPPIIWKVFEILA